MPASYKRPHKRRIYLRRAVNWIVYVCLSCLSLCLPFLHTLSWKAFGHLSVLLGVPPLPVIKPDRSAVIVLGADDDAGSNIILRLSDLGYTVFALFPSQNESLLGQNESTRKTSKVASLLYAWHRMKESSDRKYRSGIVVPISLDSRIHTQRMHVYETVRAYCASHSLRLVAMIASPPGSCENPGSLAQQPIVQGRLHKTNTAFDLLDENLSDVVAREITEPLLLVRDYLTMLQEAQGRILIISPCPIFGIGSTSPIDGARRAVSHGLRTELSPHGISVTNIITGPLRVASAGVPDSPPETQYKETVNHALLPFSIPEDEFLSAVELVMLSRHPGRSYSIGIHPYLRTVLDLEFIRLCVKFAVTQVCL